MQQMQNNAPSRPLPLQNPGCAPVVLLHNIVFYRTTAVCKGFFNKYIYKREKHQFRCFVDQSHKISKRCLYGEQPDVHHLMARKWPSKSVYSVPVFDITRSCVGKQWYRLIACLQLGQFPANNNLYRQMQQWETSPCSLHPLRQLLIAQLNVTQKIDQNQISRPSIQRRRGESIMYN